MIRPIISPRELAEAIGVSESSLKRWADEGVIKVSRTAGGHRRIAVGEAIRFIRATRCPLVRPEILGLRDAAGTADDVLSPESASDRLFAHLRDGAARQARALVASSYLSGQSVAQIADGPIQSAMERLGEMWKHDPAGIFIEHRAVDICTQAIHQLRQLVDTQPQNELALGGAASGDPYVLPSLLAATALAADGWRTINLGPDTPVESLLMACEHCRPIVVWLSVSSVGDARDLERGLVTLAEQLAAREIPLVVGGRAVEELSLPGGLLRRGATLTDLVAIADEIRGHRGVGRDEGAPDTVAPSPSAPRRPGRPARHTG